MNLEPVIALEMQMAALRHAKVGLQWLAQRGVTSFVKELSGLSSEQQHLQMARTNALSAVALLPQAEPYFWDAEVARQVVLASERYPLDINLNPDSRRYRSAWFWCDAPFFGIDAPRVGGGADSVGVHGIVAGIDPAKPTTLLAVAFGLDGGSPYALAADSWALGETPWHMGDAHRSWLADHGVDAAPTVQRLCQFVLTADQWLSQRILVASAAQIERHARKRAISALSHTPSLQIISLRAREYGPRSEGSSDAEWSCQWIVSGHWRKQFYPSTGEHLPVWIDPYLKGPEDKPLKIHGPRIFSVDR